MRVENSKVEPHLPEAEHRRSTRFSIVVPVEVKWSERGGSVLQEKAQATEVSTYGAMLRMRTKPPVGGEIELTNLLSNEATHARVVAVRRYKEGGVLEIAIALPVPSETFWGVTFRLSKTTAELLQLGKAIKEGGLDPRVLREFRDAIDYVRKTAWAVYEWQARQREQRDAQTVLSLLTVERIRRAAQLCNALAADLEAGEATHETPGIAELYPIIEQVYNRLADLLKHQD